MATIPQKELRNNVGEVLRRAEAGEELVVTVSGRAVATLGPAPRRAWVAGSPLRELFAGPAPTTMDDDIGRLDAALADPFD